MMTGAKIIHRPSPGSCINCIIYGLTTLDCIVYIDYTVTTAKGTFARARGRTEGEIAMELTTQEICDRLSAEFGIKSSAELHRIRISVNQARKLLGILEGYRNNDGKAKAKAPRPFSHRVRDI
jgi:hypothetical protein